ncbi:MAG: hypothetical protein ACFFD8_08585, partial [Candidatus Thorarchaeota archaeon]
TETTVAKAPLSQIPEEAVESPVPSEVISTQPLAIPADVLASLMARGRQLTIEEEYAKNGTESDELFEELSQAAGESDFELEELIDNFINERAELERLDDLYEKEEVSGRVYERLKAEYDDKLRKMDEQIQAGVIHLKGYQVQIQLDLDNAKEELDTIEARILIGDEEDSDKKQKSKLTEKTKRLEYALLATQHILQKESTMRNGPLSRFEVTETTLADSQLAPSVSEDPEELKESEESDKTERTSPEPKSTTPSPDRSASQPEAEAGKICNQCGRVTASEAQFCIHCGSPL